MGDGGAGDVDHTARIIIDAESGERLVVKGDVPGGNYEVIGSVIQSVFIRGRDGHEALVHEDGKIAVYTPAAALEPKVADDSVVLLGPAARSTVTPASYGNQVRLPVGIGGVTFMCDLTAAVTDAADTLDVFVQTRVCGFWTDVVHFTQMLGDGGAKRYISKITTAVTTAEFENATALGAAAVRNLIGDAWRVKWALVDADADASFTFSVHACPM